MHRLPNIRSLGVSIPLEYRPAARGREQGGCTEMRGGEGGRGVVSPDSVIILLSYVFISYLSAYS